MTIERIREIRYCLDEESIEAMDVIYEDFYNNHRLENIPLIMAALTDNSNQMESIDFFHHLLHTYIIEKPAEVIPAFLRNIDIVSPDAIYLLGISINSILSDETQYGILFNSIDSE